MAKKTGYAVLVLGVFGTSVARALVEARQDVLVIDQDAVAVRRDHRVAVIAVERDREGEETSGAATALHPNPEPDSPFREGDRLVILGSDSDLERFQSVR